jgi:transposase
MYKKTPALKLTVVKYYLNGRKTLKATAQKFDLHYQTVFKWVKLYKTKGRDALLSSYKRPWNRTEKSLEQKVMLLKEHTPSTTIKQAKDILAKEGYTISIKGIWGIWKRYGLTKRPATTPRSPFGPQTKEANDIIKRAENHITSGKIAEAASIINQLPSWPMATENEILLEIPEKLLSPRRKLERLAFLLGKVPFPEYAKKTKQLQLIFEKEGLHYSAFLTGLFHLNALQWMSNPKKEIKLIQKLRGFADNIHDPSIRFILNADEAKSHAILLDAQKSVKLLRKCKRILYRKANPYFLCHIGGIFIFLQDFKSALPLLKKAIESEKKKIRKQTIAGAIALCLAKMGNYSDSSKFLKYARRNTDASISIYLAASSFIAFRKGKLSEIFSLIEKALQITQKNSLYNNFLTFTITRASVYAALGDLKKAFSILRKYHSLMKSRFLFFASVKKIIMRKETSSGNKPEKMTGLPTLDLLSLLIKAQTTKKYTDYCRVLQYAKNKGLVGILHQFIVFFPEIVNITLEKGKPTELPKAILKFPVFNKKIPVYNINFLGRLIVYKNHKYKKIKLSPKDKSLLIHLALKTDEPDKCIPFRDLYQNFWKESKNPENLLSHALVRIKQELNIPSHYLCISHRNNTHTLLNKGIHFITDFDEYKKKLINAKALIKTDKWQLAYEEFKKAFSLYRGEPFRKMYDEWSDDKRLECIFSYQNEILSFAKNLVLRNKKEEAEKLLSKSKKITPYSEEIENFLHNLQ